MEEVEKKEDNVDFVSIQSILANLKSQINDLQDQLQILEKKERQTPVVQAPAVLAPAAQTPAVQAPQAPAVQAPAAQAPAALTQAPPSKTKKAVSGFDTPEKITDELALFIGLQGGQEISRTVANQHILNYIKRNNLQDKTNPKRILPDEKLIHLLRLQEVKEELTYFNIHKYIMACKL